MIAHRIATCTGLETRECCGTSGGWRQLKRVEQRRDKLQVQVRLAQNCSPTRWTWHVTRMNVDTRPEVLPTPSCSPPSFAPHSPLSSCGTSDSSVRVGKRLVYTLYELSCVGGSTKFAHIHFRRATVSITMRSLPSLRSSVHASFRPPSHYLWLRTRYVSTTPQRRSDQVSTSPSDAPVVQSKGKEKETSPGTDAAAAVAQDELPLLQRPLGVKEKPKARSKTWSDTKEKFMDQDKRIEERTHLCVSVFFAAYSRLTEGWNTGRGRRCVGTFPT